MSIHLPEYVRPPPPLQPRTQRVLAIWTNQVRAAVGALTIVCLAFLYILFIAETVVLFYFAGFAFFPLGSLGIFDAAYSDLLTFFFLVLLAAGVGAGVVSGDLANRAMTLYLARPITVLDYLVAKASAAGFLLSLGIVVPGLIADTIVLSLGDIGLSTALTAAGGILLVGWLLVLAVTGLSVLLSTLTRRTWLAGPGIFGVLIGSEIVAAVLNGITGQTSLLYLSLYQDELAVAAWAFNVGGNGLAPLNAGAALFLAGAIPLLLAFARLRTTEVVAE